MRSSIIIVMLLSAGWFGACGDDSGADDTIDSALVDTAGYEVDATDATSPDSALPDSAPPDTAVPDSTPADSAHPDSVQPDSAQPDSIDDTTSVPLIGEVLSCGKRAQTGGVPRGDTHVKYTIDTTRFPDALCNDGSPAVFFFRPYEGEENRDRWVIQLKGGGACFNGAECAKRWCSVLTNFGKTQMVADINDPPITAAGPVGILSRDHIENPFAGYNQVFANYCSSDGWAGTARDKVVDTFAPCDPAVPGAICPDGSACPGEDAGPMAGLCADSPVRFRMHFLGHAIVDAILATLRQDGGPAPAHAGVSLPDLDEADYVLLAGSSGGGAGVINNLDRVAATLRDNNTACRDNAPCPLVVDGLIDSIYRPSLEGLDLTDTQVCEVADACTYESAMRLSASAGDSVFHAASGDTSCTSWHAEHDPGSEWRCADYNHVVRHHLTTPFMLRMGLIDQNLGSNFLALNVKLPDGEPVDTLLEFAQLLQPQLAWFSDWSIAAEEASPGAIAPAVFGPGCPKHETLSSDPSVYDTTIEFMGSPRHFFDAWTLWKSGAPAVLVADRPADSQCAE